MCKAILQGIYVPQNLIEPSGGLLNAVIVSIIQYLYTSKRCIYRADPNLKHTPIYLSLEQLAQFACVSQDSVRRSLNNLNQLKLIVLQKRNGQKYGIQPLMHNIEEIMSNQIVTVDFSTMTPGKMQGVPLANCEGLEIYTYNIIYIIYYNMIFDLVINDPKAISYRDYWKLYHKLVGSDTRCSSSSKLKAKFNALCISNPQMLRDSLYLEFQIKFYGRDTSFDVRSRSFATFLNQTKQMDQDDLLDSSIDDLLNNPFTTRRPEFWAEASLPIFIKEKINGTKIKQPDTFQDTLSRSAEELFSENFEQV
tara:strand:+ start:274 stop:1197 length:924 start_codon:yes stop_codon:yes gene_type:complete